MNDGDFSSSKPLVQNELNELKLIEKVTCIEEENDEVSFLPAPAPVKGEYKYDFVKVRVWLADHFYVLSRYILSRALVGTKVTPKDAVKIALEVKKTLVGLGLLDIVQEQFEDYLYKTMMMFRYGETHVSRYRMMSSFHHKRIPLMILLSGTGCIGKSSIAAKLAERFNLPSVLQTNVVLQMMSSVVKSESESLSTTSFKSEKELLEKYQKECQIVRAGVDYDIQKCLKEGKAIIIEGSHIDPLYYLSLMEQLANSNNASDDSSSDIGIIVPFILTLSADNHKRFMRCAPSSAFCRQLNSEHSDLNEKELEDLLNLQLQNLQTIQRYLVSSASMKNSNCAFQIVPMDIDSFDATLDTLHDAVLERIEEQYKKKKW